MGFQPFFGEGGRDLWKVLCHYMNAGWLVGILNPTCCNQIHFNFLHSKIVGMQKHLPSNPLDPQAHSYPNEPPGETFTT